ncbi:MAG: hypothetical protein OHK0046_44870 [Anaerolineae bacterium]
MSEWKDIMRSRFAILLLLLTLLVLTVQFSISAQETVFTVDTTSDESDANIGDGVCATAEDACSLRAAIEEANAGTGTFTIEFAIGTGEQTIAVTKTKLGERDDTVPDSLTITAPQLTIDGTTQPGYTNTPLITLDGSGYDAFTSIFSDEPVAGLRIEADGVVVRGLSLVNFYNDEAFVPDAGIMITGNDAIIQGNYLGLYPNGETQGRTQGYGVYILDGSNNLIGGTQPGQGNVIGGHSTGVYIYEDAELPGIADSNRVQGNMIGVAIDGVTPRPNDNGIGMGGRVSNALIGGTQAGAGNVISGNTQDGLSFGARCCVPPTQVQGNIIGLDLTGEIIVGNGGYGIELATGGDFEEEAAFIIGGTAEGAGNVVSGNGSIGINLRTGNAVVQGNIIGLNQAGNAARPNNTGMQIDMYAISRDSGGVSIIGGTEPGSGNIISGNTSSGISLYNIQHPVYIQNNIIGGDITGQTAIGNGGSGISTGFFTVINHSVIIGGVNAGNQIFGNGGDGVFLNGGSSTNPSAFLGNTIGTNLDGDNLSNGGVGIWLRDGTGTRIGGSAEGEGNTIFFNDLSGVLLSSGVTRSPIRGNRIAFNQGLGIDLSSSVTADGVTPNDLGDTDSGANAMQNYPFISDATVSGAQITITGSVDTNPLEDHRIDFFANDFCDPEFWGEGQYYLGAATVETAGDGLAAFSVTLPYSVGRYITATATDSFDNTSEFSLCFDLGSQIGPTATPTEPASTPTATTDSGASTPTATVTTDPSIPTATPDPNLPTATPTTPGTTALQRIAPAANAVIDQGSEYVSKFQWTAVSGAAWYHVFVSSPDLSQVFFDKWYMASAVCNGNTCTTPDDIWLVGNGEFAWWMTYWSESIGADYLNLYNESRFTLSLPQPGTTTGTAPTGNVSGSITLQWNANPNALWYQVWAGPADYSDTSYLQWLNGSEVCAGGVCEVNIGTLAANDYEFWLQAWNPAGQTDWARMTEFTVTP